MTKRVVSVGGTGIDSRKLELKRIHKISAAISLTAVSLFALSLDDAIQKEFFRLHWCTPDSVPYRNSSLTFVRSRNISFCFRFARKKAKTNGETKLKQNPKNESQKSRCECFGSIFTGAAHTSGVLQFHRCL